MISQYRYVVVDEYDTVRGYYTTQEEAETTAVNECVDGMRTTYILRFDLVRTFACQEEVE